ncbi:hypothetical protein A3Q56_00444 [Intoshia linei]|uniref:Uncharacterized protein n=1 Tax=Intoshia linei TaxID=1819745 RepID=A0A177BBP4_9BILA|nr:hypothetical protein A3Q56_00444 [Intoshia linei]
MVGKHYLRLSNNYQLISEGLNMTPSTNMRYLSGILDELQKKFKNVGTLCCEGNQLENKRTADTMLFCLNVSTGLKNVITSHQLGSQFYQDTHPLRPDKDLYYAKQRYSNLTLSTQAEINQYYASIATQIKNDIKNWLEVSIKFHNMQMKLFQDVLTLVDNDSNN